MDEKSTDGREGLEDYLKSWRPSSARYIEAAVKVLHLLTRDRRVTLN